MKHKTYDVDSLDKFAMDQILTNVRRELEKYGDVPAACLCLTGFNRNGEPVFHALQEDWTPSYHESVDALVRSCQAIKVLSVSDSQKAIVIYLIRSDGSVEWTITQAYRKNGKQFTWNEPEKINGGSQNLVPAWGLLVNAK